jgi:putative DNA primase/helicase
MNDSTLLTIRPATQLLEPGPEARPFMLEPIVAPGTAALIYGASGVGKSFLALGLALAAAGGGSFLGWTAPCPHKVLYLDGEMSRDAVASRLRLFGPPPPSFRMWLASEQDGENLDLSTEAGLLRLMASWGAVDLVVIDSLSSLAGTTHGDPESWTSISRFLAFNQEHGRAIVMVHHANRDGAMRGISRRADAMDLIMALRRPRDWQPADGARFEVHLEKARHHVLAAGPIEAQLRTAEGRGHWQWGPAGTALLRRAADLLQQGMTAEAVGKTMGVSRRTAFRLQRRARELGWVRRSPGNEAGDRDS